jgi:hypothetical protein
MWANEIDCLLPISSKIYLDWPTFQQLQHFKVFFFFFFDTSNNFITTKEEQPNKDLLARIFKDFSKRRKKKEVPSMLNHPHGVIYDST